MTTRAFDEPPGWFQRQPNGSWLPELAPSVPRVPRLAWCRCQACELARTPTLRLRPVED
jgi:hypothetical protein